MSVFGIGIDIVEVPRIAAGIEKHGAAYLAKIFTEEEQSYCEQQHTPAIHFAARFAAKEAVAKALGCGIGGNAGLKDIEVRHGASGGPEIHLSAAAKDFAKAQGIGQILISLTHTREYAAANAVALATG